MSWDNEVMKGIFRAYAVYCLFNFKVLKLALKIIENYNEDDFFDFLRVLLQRNFFSFILLS